jgi:choline dehydrogenase-like flavoprotein
MFGGTTSIWGGRCVPLDPIDFERRDYVANSGWPISYDEVARYYPRALEYCDAGTFDFSVEKSLPGKIPTIAGLDNNEVLLADRIERYSLPTHFGKRYHTRLEQSGNVTVILHARCVALKKSAGEDRIEAIEIVDRAGQRKRVQAQAFVLATGGMESTRLLLASDPAGRGIGNASDHLGRYYACHFENVFGKLIPNGAAVAFDFEKTADGVYCRRKMQFSADAQRQHRLLNTAFRLHFPEYSDASHGSPVMSSIYLAKSILLPEYQMILQHGAQLPVKSPAAAHLRNVVTGVPTLIAFAFDWLFRRILATRKLPYTLVPNADGSFPLEFNSEQTPMASSRITLANEVDRHGLRRVHADWRICEDDVEAAKRAFALLRETLQRTPFCRLEYDEERLHSSICRSVPLGGHHIGTTRMAASAANGVVDTNCAVFEAPNLLIASSSVFPTSSHANPTLTIVALTLRLSDYLKVNFKA